MKRKIDYQKLSKDFFELLYEAYDYDMYRVARNLISLGYDYDELIELGIMSHIIEEAMTNDMNNEY